MGAVRLADDFCTRRNVGNARQPASAAMTEPWFPLRWLAPGCPTFR